jgi:hypothetical protein
MECRYHLHFPINDKSKSVLWVERKIEVDRTGQEQKRKLIVLDRKPKRN